MRYTCLLAAALLPLVAPLSPRAQQLSPRRSTDVDVTQPVLLLATDTVVVSAIGPRSLRLPSAESLAAVAARHGLRFQKLRGLRAVRDPGHQARYLVMQRTPAVVVMVPGNRPRVISAPASLRAIEAAVGEYLRLCRPAHGAQPRRAG